ncbi:MAG: beta strand repeat-containing protein [Agromyces sp.]
MANYNRWAFQLVAGGVDVHPFIDSTIMNYTVTGLTPGTTYQVFASATLQNQDGHTQLYSTQVTTLASAGLLDLSPVPGSVSISGSTIVGQTLSANAGSWPTGTTLSYAWLLGQTVIGANSSIVVPNSAAGSTLTVRVTGTKTGYKAVTLTSAASSLVTGGTFARLGSAEIGGWNGVAPAAGDSLYVNSNNWSPNPSARSIQWLSDGVPISGATSDTYTVLNTDAGHAISAQVTGTLSGYTDGVVTSAATPAVLGLDFSATGVPSISGSAAIGATLTASPDASAWTPTPDAFRYQWLRNGTEISGATSSTYTVVQADGGTNLSVRVSAFKALYSLTAATSTVTAIPGSLFSSAPTPTIGGTLRVGSTLSVTEGSWTPTQDAFSYQWNRNGVAISGATSASYSLVVADQGALITVDVTASKLGYVPTTKRSAATAAIGAGLYSTVTAPTISGVARVGGSLTVTAGSYSPTPDSLRYQWYRGSTAISGATTDTYVPVAADLGATLRASVTAVKTGYTTTASYSPYTAAVANGVFSAGTPSITGSTAVGSLLTAAPGTWSPAPDSLTYQWFRGVTAITGATASTYTSVSADVGFTLTVVVTAMKTAYSTTTATSAPTGVIMTSYTTTPTPTITGTARVGSVLTANPGTWSPTPTSFSYQWNRAGSPISGATAATYQPVAADIGSTLTVSVTGNRLGYTAVTRTSLATAAITSGVFTTAPVPTISGTVRVGATLTAVTGTWAPTPDSFQFQWYRGTTAITGATSASYTLTAAEQGAAIKVSVTAVKAGVTSVTTTSAATVAVAAGVFSSAPVPTITGTVRVGLILSATTGTWAPTPDSFRYQWYRGTTAITGATASTYTLVAADLGAAIKVTVTAVKVGYTSTAVSSLATAAVAAGSFTTSSVPTITGTARVGFTLTASPGTWSPTPDSYKYQWYRGSTAITGATAAGYLVTAADVGFTLRVVLTVAKAGYKSVSVSSSSTTVVTR